jgi:hypothetical protein
MTARGLPRRRWGQASRRPCCGTTEAPLEAPRDTVGKERRHISGLAHRPAVVLHRTILKGVRRRFTTR